MKSSRNSSRPARLLINLALCAALLILVPLLLGAALLQDEQLQDAGELIRAYTALPEGAVEEKTALLDRIQAAGTDEAVRFIAREMDHAGEDPVRARAFFLWASNHTSEIVREYLETKRRSARFGALIPVIPALSGFDALTFLKDLYEDSSLIRFRKQLFEAIASLGGAEAFAYLQERWRDCETPRMAYDLFQIILAMKESRAAGFLDGLLAAEEPYARYEGARGLLAVDPVLSLRRVEIFLQTETHPGVRSNLLRDLAGVGSADAARVILATCDWHARGRLHEIVDALGAMPQQSVADALGGEWHRDDRPRRFQVAALVLSSLVASEVIGKAEFAGSLEVAARIKPAEKSSDPGICIVAAVARGRLVSNRDRIQRLMSSGDLDSRWKVLQAIECYRLCDEIVVKKLLALLSPQTRWEIRIKTLETLGTLGIAEALPLMEKSLASRKLLLRIAAVRALERIREKESVRILIERLGKEEGRCAWEIARSLKSLTGKTFAVDHEAWESWWNAVAESFTPVPDPEEVAWSLIPVDTPSSRYSFYGLAIDSHNIVFVIDVSGSMAGPRFGNAGDETPIARLRRELTRSIQSLTGEHFINMVFFSNNVRRWRKELVSMNDEAGGAKAEALVIARYLRAEGGTNLYGALMAAMSDEEVDALVLLSDGDPTVGEIVDKDRIVEEVLERNRLLQARIHVIALGEADRSFLRRLALGTNGTFKSF